MIKHLGIDKFEWHRQAVRSKMKPTQLRVLLCVWDYTNKAGTNAHPGADRIATDLGINKREVRRALSDLEDHSWLLVLHPGGNKYGKGTARVYGLGPGPESQAVSDKRYREVFGEEHPRKGGETHPPSSESKGGESRPKGGEFCPTRVGKLPTPSDQGIDHIHHSDTSVSASPKISATTPEVTDWDRLNRDLDNAGLDFEAFMEDQFPGYQSNHVVRDGADHMAAHGYHAKAIYNYVNKNL